MIITAILMWLVVTAGISTSDGIQIMPGASYIRSEISRLDVCIERAAASLERLGPRGICYQTFESTYSVQQQFDAAVKKKAELVIALQGLE